MPYSGSFYYFDKGYDGSAYDRLSGSMSYYTHNINVERILSNDSEDDGQRSHNNPVLDVRERKNTL